MEDRVVTVIPDELDGERLDRALAVLAGISRSAAGRLVSDGDVTLDGIAESGRTRVSVGQALAYQEAAAESPLAPEEIDFEVVLEDEHVVVVDKPEGLTVHPGAGRSEGTLAGGLLYRYPEIEGVGQKDRWGIVHRLDRETSGLLVVARTAEAYDGLVNQVRERQMRREYLALVDGEFVVPTGSIEAPIARDPARPTRRRVMSEGKHALTHYSVDREFPRDGLTLVRVRLETGRTHQIRVHFAAIDHPLAGDRLYRTGPDRVPVPRLFLHAVGLGFSHPVSGEDIDVVSALPADLAGLLEQVR